MGTFSVTPVMGIPHARILHWKINRWIKKTDRQEQSRGKPSPMPGIKGNPWVELNSVHLKILRCSEETIMNKWRKNMLEVYFLFFFLLLDGVLPLQIPFTVVELVEGLFPYLVQLKTGVFITQPRKFRLTHYLKSEKNGVYWAKRKKGGGQRLLAKQQCVLLALGLPAWPIEFHIPPRKRRGKAPLRCKRCELLRLHPSVHSSRYTGRLEAVPGSPSYLAVSKWQDCHTELLSALLILGCLGCERSTQ